MIEPSSTNPPPTAPFIRAASSAPMIPPTDVRIETRDWQAFAETQANILMVGDLLTLMRVLTVGWSRLRRPIVWCDEPRLRLPTGPVGTFILRCVDELSGDDQQHLIQWLDGAGATRVIALSPRALFPLVQDGIFAPDLYYRLNNVLLTTP